MKKPLKVTLISVRTVLAAGAAVCGLILAKIFKPNELFVSGYEVKGVDVSSYQGIIDWDKLSRQDISFAYIKATEGSSWTDERFSYNFNESKNAGIIAGAYHFFSFDSSGAEQAEHFIDTVPVSDKALPPAIDLEFYGSYFDKPPKKEKVLKELRSMADKLEEHYGVKPVIYTTGKAFSNYIEDTEFEDYSTWTRQVYVPFAKADSWDIWQYSDTAELDGYNGDEKCIDMNVFNGTKEQFDKYCEENAQKE
ncbi:MAG: glycosyl hydrolase family 25 [Ruminococcus sp.]|nr:glycosyl hydrolase family 25 [Ruminococcus sp.]